MEKNNEYYLKVQGKANIAIPLAIGHNFRITADASITQEQKDDNEDGSVSITYKAVPITIEIGKDNGPTIRAKDPRRNSEKLRKYLWKLWNDHKGVIYDFQDVYSEVTLVAMLHMPELLDEAVNRLEEKK